MEGATFEQNLICNIFVYFAVCRTKSASIVKIPKLMSCEQAYVNALMHTAPQDHRG